MKPCTDLYFALFHISLGREEDWCQCSKLPWLCSYSISKTAITLARCGSPKVHCYMASRSTHCAVNNKQLVIKNTLTATFTH